MVTRGTLGLTRGHADEGTRHSLCVNCYRMQKDSLGLCRGKPRVEDNGNDLERERESKREKNNACGEVRVLKGQRIAP